VTESVPGLRQDGAITCDIENIHSLKT
jgi:hypothetical protein